MIADTVGPADAPTYSASAILVFIVGAASCWLPAQRAMQVDPVDTIHYE